jgi:predicted component of type VI protein secretion system
MDTNIKNILDQLGKMMEVSINHKIEADFQPDNLRIRDDGILVLIDFREELDEDQENIKNPTDLFYLYKSMINSFAPSGEIYDYLIARCTNACKNSSTTALAIHEQRQKMMQQSKLQTPYYTPRG